MPPISSPSLSPAHAATLQALAGLSPLDAIGRLHSMPKALSVALCVSCGVDREDHAWASKLHDIAFVFAVNAYVARSAFESVPSE